MERSKSEEHEARCALPEIQLRSIAQEDDVQRRGNAQTRFQKRPKHTSLFFLNWQVNESLPNKGKNGAWRLCRFYSPQGSFEYGWKSPRTLGLSTPKGSSGRGHF